MLMGAALIARLILALSDSFLLDLSATTFVVETPNTINETSNILIAFMSDSPFIPPQQNADRLSSTIGEIQHVVGNVACPSQRTLAPFGYSYVCSVTGRQQLKPA